MPSCHRSRQSPPRDRFRYRTLSLAIRRVAGWTLAAGLLAASTAQAGPNSGARILVHLASPTTKSPCTAPASQPTCSGIVTAGDLYPAAYYAYVLGTDGLACAGFSGLQFGIDYDAGPNQGIDIYSWASCGESNLPTLGWPSPGTGITVGWNAAVSCRRNEPGGMGTGVTAAAGYFYLAAYSPDALAITTPPGDGKARVIDCTGDGVTIAGPGAPPGPSALGYASFSAGGGTPGYNPCGTATAVAACVISGPASLGSFVVGWFRVEAPACESGIQWSAVGAGRIIGSTTGDSVLVRGEGAGILTVRASGNLDGVPFSCERSVAVPSLCHIAGPSPVSAGQIATYSALDVPGATFAWTIAGSGVISGATNTRVITVNTGLSGSFMLGLTVTAPTGTQHCDQTIPIQSGSNCMICCRDEVYAGAGATSFYATNAYPATLAWSVTGNGSIVGSTSSFAVSVMPGPAANGPFTLNLTATSPNFVRTCSRLVNVLEPGPPPPNRNQNAKIMLHVVNGDHTGCDLGGCRNFAARIPCESAVTRGRLYPRSHYAAVLVARAETDGSALSGISGGQFGIDYHGGVNPLGGLTPISIYGWTLTANFEVSTPDWPEPGSGNRIFPTQPGFCITTTPGGSSGGVSAQLGYFYLAAYSADTLSITPHPEDGVASVIDCYLREWPVLGKGAPANPYPLGSAVFTASGTVDGYNPCDAPVNIQSTTWSRIKNLLPPAAPRRTGGK